MTTFLQLQIIANKSGFKVGEDYYGVELWEYIREEVDPTTMTRVSRSNDEIKSKILEEFSHTVKYFHIWFQDTISKITCLKDNKKYNEYIHSIFRTYLPSGNKDFFDTTKGEENVGPRKTEER